MSLIQTSTLTQQVVSLLKQRILDGELLSGQRVWAADLSQEFGVSLAPVKEALLILQGEGLILNVPRRGSIVRQFTPRDVKELIYIRNLIEADAACCAVKQGKVTTELIERLNSHNEAIGSYRTAEGEFSDRIIPYEHDRRFHDILVDACGKKMLTEWYQRLNVQAQIVRLAIWNIGPRGDKTYHEHRAIIKALEANDLKGTRKAIKVHLDSIIEDFNRVAPQDGENIGQTANGTLPHGRRQLKSDSNSTES
ncbi:MAG: GntR family transcriptional regulator [Deltaproteobacteria bacterium]|jgi:DNA-binding GntR family transcriptional regulator|nr:GntR family transcriptional regulator [Deltaproteobacteria bacterium]